MGELTITSGALASAILQLIKLGWRKWVVQNPDYDFPTAFYAIMLPLLNALAPFALVAIGFPSTDPVLALNWQGVALYALRVVISSVVSLVSYNGVTSLTRYEPNKETE